MNKLKTIEELKEMTMQELYDYAKKLKEIITELDEDYQLIVAVHVKKNSTELMAINLSLYFKKTEYGIDLCDEIMYERINRSEKGTGIGLEVEAIFGNLHILINKMLN